MKKFLHGLAGLLIVLIVGVGGAALVYGNGFNTDLRNRAFALVQESPWYGQAVGGILILLVLLYLVTWGRPRQKIRTISFDSDGGTVSIGVSAVSNFIRKLGDEFGAVLSMEPRIRSRKDLIRIDLDVKIQTGTRIPELSQLLQDRVRESIRDGLGIVEVSEIKVHIREIIGAPPPSTSA